MYKCPNCDFKTPDTTNYCPQCGSKTVFEQPVNTAAPTEQITYVEPISTLTVEPAPIKKPHLAKKIVGMALSIGAFIFAIIASIYTLVFTAIDGVMGFALGLVYALMGLPPAIIGLVMSKKNIANGDTSAFGRLGKIFGIISIIVLSVGLFVSIIALSSGHSVLGYTYY